MNNAERQEITVNLAERSYPIYVGPGLIAQAGELITPFLRRKQTAIVTDETVAAIHLKPLEAALEAAGISYQAIVLPPGEQTKSFAELERLTDRILEIGIERGDVIIALGGGVIGDLTGFAASIVRRGVDFVQIPTTLLAQVDSSVGGKTAVNSRHGKNLIGAFYQPRVVIADTAALDTLSKRELLAGYAEVVKYGLINKPDFFAWLEENGRRLIDGDQAARVHAVATSCAAKAEIVAADEREGSVRALLNLGHTFGHALEAAFGYDGTLLHGEAVAIGMRLAFDLSVRLGLCAPEEAARVHRHFLDVGLPTRIEDIKGPRPDADQLIAIMAQDKKVVDGKITFILVRGIGEAFITRDVDTADVRAVLDARQAAE